jgi:hypothetical protein
MVRTARVPVVWVGGILGAHTIVRLLERVAIDDSKYCAVRLIPIRHVAAIECLAYAVIGVVGFVITIEIAPSLCIAGENLDDVASGIGDRPAGFCLGYRAHLSRPPIPGCPFGYTYSQLTLPPSSLRSRGTLPAIKGRRLLMGSADLPNVPPHD